MALRLFNTLTGNIEEFQPARDNTVRMYSCGLTVYDYGHIGNFRTFLDVDILRRYLKQSGYQVQHVLNITDVDDKIIRNAAQRGLPIGEYTAKYIQAFRDDMALLSLETPEKIPLATEHIAEMAALIRSLVEKGHAYRTEDGSYYFRISTFPEYGKLSKKDFEQMSDGARVDVDEYDKDNARDFALWKAPREGEACWETEIGPGRPGWHIECSAMSLKYLGENFDLHAGGEDLVFPHHENEIAQTEASTGCQFARFWMHVRFLLVEGEKMSKSLGNFYTLRDLVLMGHKPSSIRYLLASVPYRKQLNFTMDGLVQAASSVERLRTFRGRLQQTAWPAGENPEMKALAEKTTAAMRESLDDDLNTAQALAAVFDMVREVNAAADAGKVQAGDVAPLLETLRNFDEIFDVLEETDGDKIARTVEWARAEGLEAKISPALLESLKSAAISDAEIEALVAKHSAARKARDFKTSDAIRDQLLAEGILLENTREGVRWRRK
jgi:cysteinyl-tRNA synthetase